MTLSGACRKRNELAGPVSSDMAAFVTLRPFIWQTLRDVTSNNSHIQTFL
ncbi:hypothetical protein ABID21_003525 [Pseudorhizobium tarimense]|uniref:Uncharacterized protein n=1 Tax=Pseudorhizobium tarimense TaxID=1079109 RepID=A0ABV2HA21_9HYPH